MNAIHRTITVFATIVALYLAVTGTLIQLVDLHTLFIHAPASDPDMQAIRESIDGPPNYQVIATGDYDAAVFPASLDLSASLHTVLHSVRTAVGDAPMRYLELRMVDGQPVGRASIRGQLLRVDAASGNALPRMAEAPLATAYPPSQRNSMKWYHRMTPFGTSGAAPAARGFFGSS